MKVLGIEASGLVAGAAVSDETKLWGEFTLCNGLTHSQTLMPLVDHLIQMLQLDKKDIDYIACSSGPGSFTGLRIGAATAKGLALGLKIPIVPVPTLDALAYNIFDTDRFICPIMDARRKQVYTALYHWENGKLCCMTGHMAVEIEEIADIANQFEHPVIFLGDGVPVHKDYLQKFPRFRFAPPHCSMQRAASVAALGLKYVLEGKAISGSDFVPQYLRQSQAERELAEKQNGGTKHD